MYKYFREEKRHIKKEGIKITILYFTLGFIWIYFSDRIVSNMIYAPHIKLLINTYKGMMYVFITSLLLYYLLWDLLKKVEQTEKKLNLTNAELSAVNVELQAYIKQLTTSEGELQKKHNQIAEYNEKLNLCEEKYKTLICQMHLGVSLYEGGLHDAIDQYKLIDINHSYEALTGLKKEEILGKSFFDVYKKSGLMESEDLNQIIRTGEPVRYESTQNKTDKFYEIIGFRPKENQLAVILNDITKRKRAEGRFHFLSYHDQLTGQYNRRYFEEELKRLDKEKHYPLMITMADIRGLKLINDSFGHKVGDQYIKQASQILSEGFREKDVICRVGGDEFVILSPNTDDKQIKNKINHINSLTKNEIVSSVTLSISFGYCGKYKEEESMAEILKKAEDFMYKKKLIESPFMRGKTIYMIISALHEKNPREEQHSHRVSRLCEKMGIALGFHHNEAKELKTVGLLHDIGKVAIEEGILNKAKRLTEEEFRKIKRHPEIGYRILRTVNELSEMADYVLAHHERWDGKGYPRGLRGEEIPIQSRIISIADAYDAMVSERSYRKALSKEHAISELKKGAGAQFCKEYVNIFIEKVINEQAI